jgi:hypothetical protein
MAMAAVRAAVAVASAGCGSAGGQADAGGPAGAGPTTTPAPSSPTAPPVTNPLSVGHFIDHPCGLLTTEQAKAIGATEPGESDHAGDTSGIGPGCNWHNEATVASFGVGIITGDENGLDDIYRANQDPDYFAYFEPTTVKGYPGVFTAEKGARAHGACGLVFDVTGHSLLDAEYYGSRETKQPCAKAKQIAAAVIETIKGGS